MGKSKLKDIANYAIERREKETAKKKNNAVSGGILLKKRGREGRPQAHTCGNSLGRKKTPIRKPHSMESKDALG